MNRQKKSFTEILKNFGKKASRFFTHHWLLKLICFLAAILIWAGLISRDNTLTREKFFSNVAVNVINEDSTITNKGLIVVSGLEPETLNVDMWAAVPQSNYKDVSAANFNPRVDLSRLTASGQQVLKILTSSSNASGSVTQIAPDSVTVQVEEYVTNYRVPVTVHLNGEYPYGMGGNMPSIDPSTVSVSGPKSLVDRVSAIAVEYNLSDLNGKSGFQRIALPFHFEDVDGNTIESNLLKVTSINTVLRTVIVNHTVYPLQEAALSAEHLVVGIPASGYQVSKVEISPSSVIVGGDSIALERIHQLFLENAINVDGKSESFIQTVKIRKPSDVNYLSTDTVAVSVQISPVNGSRGFTAIKLNANGLPNSLKIVTIPKTVDVQITGFVNTLPALKANQIIASVNLAGISEPGIYSAPVTVMLSANDGQPYELISEPAEITVEVISR